VNGSQTVGGGYKYMFRMPLLPAVAYKNRLTSFLTTLLWTLPLFYVFLFVFVCMCVWVCVCVCVCVCTCV